MSKKPFIYHQKQIQKKINILYQIIKKNGHPYSVSAKKFIEQQSESEQFILKNIQRDILMQKINECIKYTYEIKYPTELNYVCNKNNKIKNNSDNKILFKIIKFFK